MKSSSGIGIDWHFHHQCFRRRVQTTSIGNTRFFHRIHQQKEGTPPPGKPRAIPHTDERAGLSSRACRAPGAKRDLLAASATTSEEA